MQPDTEHEFNFDEEEVVIGLSESIHRFAIMAGVVGMALVGLGIMAVNADAYGGGLAGPSIIATGLVAVFGAFLFVSPRSVFDGVITTQGSDISKLMMGFESLGRAHGIFRLVVGVLVLARIASLFLT